MMATGAVAVALTGREMVNFAVASGCAASVTSAAIFGASFGGRASEAPDVLALPGSAAFVRAPGATTCARDLRVAPLAPSELADPLREVASDPALFEG